MNQPAVTSKEMAGSYLPAVGQIVDAYEMTEKERFYRVALPSPLRHRPGQSVMVSVYGVGEAPISISSSPDDDHLEMVIRKVGRLTQALHGLKKGDTIQIRGPYGNGFTISEFYGKSVLFVAGGLGLVPLRSLILPVLAQKEKFKGITLLSGARSPAEELFRESLSEWSRIDGVQAIRTVDKTENQPWDHGVGLVTAPIPQLTIDASNTVAVLCGPPVMYKFVVMALSAKGIPASSIYVDMERRMKCGVGKCGHCQINHLYCCQDGPVFRFSDITNLPEAMQ